MSQARHTVSVVYSPVSVTYGCSCGWRHTELRRQNALARSSKLRAALRAHGNAAGVVLAEPAVPSGMWFLNRRRR